MVDQGLTASGSVKAPRDRDSVQAVERSLQLLALIVGADPEMGLREVSLASELPVATTHRLLKALINRGYVRQNPANRRYTVGPAAFELAARIGTSKNLAQLAQPCLEELVRLTGESANLAAIEGGEIVYLAHVDAPRVVRMFTVVGNRVPLHASGTGKAILAAVDQQERSQILAGRKLTRYTPHTITGRRQLESELDRIAERGYAFDLDEYEEGVHCIAVPVRDPRGRVNAAISVSGPSSRLTLELMEKLAPDIIRIADNLFRSIPN
jgi:IclR family transcriptional regulator, acetate operon repressor